MQRNCQCLAQETLVPIGELDEVSTGSYMVFSFGTDYVDVTLAEYVYILSSEGARCSLN